MANYYLDFVGLNTFIYEGVGWHPEDQVHNGSPGREIVFFRGAASGDLTLNMPVALNTFGYDNSVLTRTPYVINHNFRVELVDPKTGAPGADLAGLTRASASYTTALFIHRNGPYGFPTWKQIRIGDNPLTRKQIKHNIFTHVVEPGNEFEFTKDGVTRYAKNKYGNIEPFNEMCLTSRFSPIQVDYRDSTVPGSNFKLKVSVGNNIQHFNNEKLDLYYDLYTCEDRNYNRVKKLYLDKSSNSRMDNVDFLTYSETIYPQAKYTYKSYIRQRTQFKFNWRNNRSDRTKTEDFHFVRPSDYDDVSLFYLESNNKVTQSIWPLDVSSEWDTRNGNFMEDQHGYRIGNLANARANHKDFGILQNSISRYSKTVFGLGTWLSSFLDTTPWIKPSPLYFWHHMIPHSQSVVSANGMLIEGINFGTTMGDISGTYEGVTDNPALRAGALPSGETKWEANETRMVLNSNFEYVSEPRNPFYDTYDEYVSDIRLQYKNYSIIPEFRSSLFMEENLVGSGINKYDIFQITGGLENTTDSDKDNFYKIFSNSDFMKHFDVIRKEHKGIMDVDEITLTCKAAIKFLPYQGFYPADRTVELAKAFYTETRDRTILLAGDATTGQYSNAIQNIMTPLFAPGVLYNTIKSGIACDYAVITGSGLTCHTTGGIAQISSSRGEYFALYQSRNYDHTGAEGRASNMLFDYRVPFKALYEPAKFLMNKTFYSNVPSHYGNLSASAIWDGAGTINYQYMAHNFLAEVPEFFLQDKTFTSHASLPSNDPNFGNLSKTRVYYMRVMLYKTVEGTIESEYTGSSPAEQYQTPQYKKIKHGGAHENFTMYSRASAFGPPTKLGFANSLGAAVFHDPEEGENYVFTPPYYYGAGFADIKFEPNQTKKYTLYEILAGCTASFFRYHDKTSAAKIRKQKLITTVGMNVDASVNLFGIGKVTPDKLIVDTNEADAQWIIQPHFETPMLNFNHLSASSAVTLPLEGSQSVARGMWHQYGLIEKDESKGIKFAIEEIPDKWHLNAQEGTGFSNGVNAAGLPCVLSGSKVVDSLAEKVGFKTDHKTLGKLATSKKVKEAVVAVPFVEIEGERRFFKLDAQYIPIMEQLYKGVFEASQFKGYSEHVVKLFEQMQTYIFPPQMDFINNRDIHPFAMYVFEFEHNFDQQDLADMWQNLPPKLGRQFKSSTSTIRHKHLRQELLGGGENFYEDIMNIADKPAQGEFPDRLKWMVFKVKQRGESNFYKKVVGEIGQSVSLDPETGEISAGKDVFKYRVNGLQYNWPYDFFSMIELVNIEASVKMKDPNYNPIQATLDTSQAAIGAQQATNMAAGPLGPSSFGLGGTSGEKTELSRVYMPWPLDRTVIFYSDGSKETVNGDQT